MGAKGLLRPGTPGAVLEGRVENLGRRAQNNTFGGGTNEVMREILGRGNNSQATGLSILLMVEAQ